MYLSDWLPDKHTVLAQVAKLPKFAQMPEPALCEAAAKIVQAQVAERLTYEIHISVSDAVAQYEAVNGKYPADLGDEGQRRRDEYESGLDDVMENVFQEYEAGLSQNWLGTNTIDSRVWEDDGPQRVASSAAKEIWRTLTTGKTPSQVLASAGIVSSDFNTLATYNATQSEDTETMALSLDEVLVKIKQRIGTNFDMLVVYEDMQTIFDEDDETLVQSAASRLGIDMQDAEVLQIAALEFSDAPDELTTRLAAINAGPEKAKRQPRAPKTPAAPVAGQLDGSVLEALKTCGVSETGMAEQLGVSRSTFVNYAKNKSPFVPDAEQYKLIRGEVVARANMMLAALATLDGTERTEVA